MKKMTLLLAGILIACVVFSQQIPKDLIAKEYLDQFQGASKKWETYTIGLPGLDQAVVTINDTRYVHHFLIDQSFKVLSHFQYKKDSLEYKPGKSDVLETGFINNKFSYYRKFGNQIIQEELDFSKGKPVFSEYLTLEKKEKFVSAFMLKNRMYVVTIPNKSNKVRIYTDKTPGEIELNTDSLAFDFRLSNQTFTTINHTKEVPIELIDAGAKAKLYVTQSEHILLTIDEEIFWTYYFDIDLNKLSYSQYRFFKQTSDCNEIEVSKIDRMRSNSYILNDKIFQAYLCPDHLFLHIKDLRSGDLIKEFHARRDSGVAFANTEFTNRKMFTTDNQVTPKTMGAQAINSTKQLSAKKFFRGLSIIQIVVDSSAEGDIMVKLGESGPLEMGGGGGGGTFVGGGSMNTPGGVVHTAPTYRPFYGGFSSRSGVEETYFKSILNTSFQHQAKPLRRTRFDKLDDIVDELQESVAAPTSFIFGGKLYYIYYLQDAKKFFIREIE